MIRILCADDHLLLRAGIGALIATQADMQLVAEAATGTEAVQLYRQHQPDVTLMDLQMPDMDGMDALTVIRSEFPAARIIVLTTSAGDALAQRALKAAAQAYALKSLVRTRILDTISVVHKGEKCIQAGVAAADTPLTAREIEVLKLVASGHANKAISTELAINEETTKTHLKNILGKLGATDRTHAVLLAVKRGIISLWADSGDGKLTLLRGCRDSRCAWRSRQANRPNVPRSSAKPLNTERGCSRAGTVDAATGCVVRGRLAVRTANASSSASRRAAHSQHPQDKFSRHLYRPAQRHLPP